MANIAIFRINYKSDFILTLNSDAGWLTPFCIKFWTDTPSQAYFVGFDGTTYTHCAPVAGEPTKLLVQFDDHHLPIGNLKFQIGYHFTVADFPTSVEDEVINQASVIIEVDNAPAQVMLDFNGETAPEIEFSLPAYANEAQRIENEQQRIENEQQRIDNEQHRIENEQQRIDNEQQRIDNEQTRQRNEETRIENEQQRVLEFGQMKGDLEQATRDAAAAAENANEKGVYAKNQGDYAKQQGDYAKQQGDTAKADHERAEEDHRIAGEDHTQAGSDHTRAGEDHTRAGEDHTRAGEDHTRAESDHAAVEVYIDSLGAFDISSYHATGGVLTKYADLTAALGTNGANVPDALRKGGMSVKFVHSSDNKYVQFILKTKTFTTDITQWQAVIFTADVSYDYNSAPSNAALYRHYGGEKVEYDSSILVNNGLIGADGSITPSDTYKYSDDIPVPSGLIVKVNCITSSSGMYNLRVKHTNNTYSVYQNAVLSEEGTITYETQDNDVSVAFGSYVGHLDSFSASIGTDGIIDKVKEDIEELSETKANQTQVNEIEEEIGDSFTINKSTESVNIRDYVLNGKTYKINTGSVDEEKTLIIYCLVNNAWVPVLESNANGLWKDVTIDPNSSTHILLQGTYTGDVLFDTGIVGEITEVKTSIQKENREIAEINTEIDKIESDFYYDRRKVFEYAESGDNTYHLPTVNPPIVERSIAFEIVSEASTVFITRLVFRVSTDPYTASDDDTNYFDQTFVPNKKYFVTLKNVCNTIVLLSSNAFTLKVYTNKEYTSGKFVSREASEYFKIYSETPSSVGNMIDSAKLMYDPYKFPLLPTWGNEYLVSWYKKIYNEANVKIVMDGDSITASGHRDAVIRKIMLDIAHYPSAKFSLVNNAIGSTTTNEYVASGHGYGTTDMSNMPNGMIDIGMQQNPDLVIICFGMNDSRRDYETTTVEQRLEYFEENMREALQRIRGNQPVNGKPAYNRPVEDCAIILCTPTNAQSTHDDGKRSYTQFMQFTRPILQKLCREFYCGFCDFNMMTYDHDFSLMWSWNENDPIHPSQSYTCNYASIYQPLLMPMGLWKNQV